MQEENLQSENEVITTDPIDLTESAEVVSEASAPEAVEEIPVYGDDVTQNLSFYNPMYLNITDPININTIVGKLPGAGWDAIDKQMKIIQGEWNETLRSVETRNYVRLLDDVADMLFTVIGLAGIGGMAGVMIPNFQKVVQSQYKKFDYDEENWLLTKQKYENAGVEVHAKKIPCSADGQTALMYVTLSSKEQYNTLTEEIIPEGKWLKSHAWHEETLDLPSPDILEVYAPDVLAIQREAQTKLMEGGFVPAPVAETPVESQAVMDAAEVLTEDPVVVN